MALSEYAIETKNLVKSYNNKVNVLDSISIKIKRGDVVGYLGPNGAGKTTTIKILTNLLNPTSGHAYIDGIDVNKHPKEALQNIGALVEVPGVYGYLTPREMLSYFGKIYRMDNKEIDERIKEVLEIVKLSDQEHNKLSSFSTGMQRRFGIAKAILNNPEIVILDEPVLGLDPKGIKDIRKLIRRFRNDGMTVLLSSHLLQEVSETCNEVIFLDKGNIVTSGSIEDIKNKINFKTINVKFLNPLLKKDIKKISSIEEVSSIEKINEHFQIYFDGESQTSSKILSSLSSYGFEIVSYTPQRMGLEEFYISVMGDERGVK